MALDRRPLVLDIDDKAKKQSEFARVLRIRVDDTHGPGGYANTLLITAGMARFGFDGDNAPLEDRRNQNSEDLEVDEGEPRTLLLALRLERSLSNAQVAAATLAESAGFAAIANVGLTTGSPTFSSNSFGAAVDNAKAELTAPVVDGVQLDRDLWLKSDVIAESSVSGLDTGDARNQLNRAGFQAWAALQIDETKG